MAQRCLLAAEVGRAAPARLTETVNVTAAGSYPIFGSFVSEVVVNGGAIEYSCGPDACSDLYSITADAGDPAQFYINPLTPGGERDFGQRRELRRAEPCTGSGCRVADAERPGRDGIAGAEAGSDRVGVLMSARQGLPFCQA
jgi:hypothetical protein